MYERNDENIEAEREVRWERCLTLPIWEGS